MIDLTIMPSLIEFNAKSWFTPALRDYLAEQELDFNL